MRIVDCTYTAEAMNVDGRVIVPVFRLRFILTGKTINAVSVEPIMCVLMEGDLRYPVIFMDDFVSSGGDSCEE
ncbi:MULTISPECIES: hypothetical protein [Methanothermobacter]|uniref:Uncharacterized protein n=1 Tax=Methanothermobacter marburgensis (strain ATCC BAA-927 / DSM 2133 / JCM 14651 / NBRC 100331 / OCM 82 / Marburg) TaxID=79929 RepID=D9PWK2_METTM|nr:MULTISPECIES: hypothetical protein [Methanothermobacter]ADL58600.1 conserved hypothetical protein [Methanothermobacter marburgensis str. Marburg]QEF95172.1 hypothetical protein FVF72_08440 [Methanothermobacter sp. KEPCO-1]QHN08180.1 hypothetical protein FZP68_05185 [Methanothermobacter sp. THM-2]WBF09187.1 hypothetical protein ISG34_04970 [Methanothermobacter marburgensis]